MSASSSPTLTPATISPLLPPPMANSESSHSRPRSSARPRLGTETPPNSLPTKSRTWSSALEGS
jgi:hypothetical protein